MVPMEAAESALLLTYLEFVRKERAPLFKRIHSHQPPTLENHFFCVLLTRHLDWTFLMKLTFSKSKVIQSKTWCCFPMDNSSLGTHHPSWNSNVAEAGQPVLLVKNNGCLTKRGELCWHLPCELLSQWKALFGLSCWLYSNRLHLSSYLPFEYNFLLLFTSSIIT